MISLGYAKGTVLWLDCKCFRVGLVVRFLGFDVLAL